MKDFELNADPSSFHFNKVNLVALLLIVHEQRNNGIFFMDLHAALIAAAKEKGDAALCPPGRSTWFAYFKELKEIYPCGINPAEALRLAVKFVADHPKKTAKYYKKFNPVTFNAMRDFLLRGGYLHFSPLGEALGGMDGSLYYSLVDFLKPTISTAGDHISLPGTYRVYRPSLSVPGKFVVSAARMKSRDDGALYYAERMHFHTGFGWRTQFFEGYVLGAQGKAFLFTKDDNTRLIQLSIMKPIMRATAKAGKSVVSALAGKYNGASQNCPDGLFSTGIVMVRDQALEKLTDYPVQRWKVGHLRDFGLMKSEEIPEHLRRYLHS